MPRRPRLNLTDVPQHIIQRGNNRQATFFADEDYRFYLDCLYDATRKYEGRVYAYVLMTNHVHLLASAAAAGSGLAFCLIVIDLIGVHPCSSAAAS
jgi:putative transposase